MTDPTLPPKSPLPIQGKPDTPAFGCLVYVCKNETGGVHARVANLAGLEIDAASERDALGKLVPVFRSKVAALLEAGEEIPWLDPPSPKRDDEQKRFLPVHL
ncbi:MAG: hypothetical protein AAF989_02430 [Planctomycetota bacterium]